MKDILLIMSDQHGQAYVQMEGRRIHTPHMMRIAEEGLSFSYYCCNAPLCVPSRVSFLSGKISGELQIFNNDTTLPIDMPTIAHTMGIRGYRTVLVGRIHFKEDDQNHGFDKQLVGDITSQYWETDGKQRADFGAYTGISSRKHCLEVMGGGYSPVMAYDEAVFQATIEYLEKEYEELLFLTVSFYGSHFPFTCEPSLYRHYEELLGKGELTALDCENRYLGYRQTFTVEKAWSCKAARYDQMETLDDYMGRLYGKLRQRSRKQLLIYVSDHGEWLGKHRMSGKQTLHQESIRVPSLATGTGMGPGTHHGQVSLLDVSKTILAEAGADGSWHRGTATSLDKEEEPRPPVVIQQMLDLGGESTALTEAVIHVPFKAVEIGDAVRVYRLGESGEGKLCTSEEDREFLTETMAYSTSDNIVRKYIRQELELRKRHDILEQWGKAKKPPEPARMPIPECAREMPME